MFNLREWALRWGLPFEAILELEHGYGMHGTPSIEASGKSEAWAQSSERIHLSRCGIVSWRNNVGVLPDENGRPVRYGLANESQGQNEKMKSSDVIAIDPTPITLADVGQPRGQLVAAEAKPPGWVYTGQGREPAQLAFINLVNAKGGRGYFTTGRVL